MNLLIEYSFISTIIMNSKLHWLPYYSIVDTDATLIQGKEERLACSSSPENSLQSAKGISNEICLIKAPDITYILVDDGLRRKSKKSHEAGSSQVEYCFLAYTVFRVAAAVVVLPPIVFCSIEPQNKSRSSIQAHISEWLQMMERPGTRSGERCSRYPTASPSHIALAYNSIT